MPLQAQNEFCALEYFDWGSQSIAQSKFQRTTSFLGERFPRDHSRNLSSTFFRTFFRKTCWKEPNRFLGLLSHSPRSSRRLAPKGWQTMQTGSSRSRPFWTTFPNIVSNCSYSITSLCFFQAFRRTRRPTEIGAAVCISCAITKPLTHRIQRQHTCHRLGALTTGQTRVAGLQRR